MLATQIIDESIGNLADILKGFTTSFWGLTLFVFLAMIYGFGQYFILGMIKAKNKEQQIKRSHFNMLETVVTVVQVILIK
jgi:heme/copper-type cytochrome/quinol oxidase subunit 2